MPPSVFISYARADGYDLAEELSLELRARKYSVFFDDRSISAGDRWRRTIDDHIDECLALIVVLTPRAFDSAEVESEWNEALSRHKPVCGLLAPKVLPDAVPSRLKIINLVSGENLDAALARIELWLKKLVAERPLAAPPSTPAVQPAATPAGAGGAPVRVVGDWPWNVKGQLRGREGKADELATVVADPKASIVTVVGRPGIGKTALACRVLHDLQIGVRSTRVDRRRLDGIALLGSRTGGLTLDDLIAGCVNLLGEHGSPIDRATTLSLEGKVKGLLDALSGGVYIILLDHLDDQLDPGGRVADPALQLFLETFLKRPLNVCLVLTCRESLVLPADAAALSRQVEVDGLGDADGAEVLRDLDADDTRGLKNAEADRLAAASQRLHGIPRALELFAGRVAEDQFFDWNAWVEALGDRADAGHPDAVEAGALLNDLIRESYERLSPAEQRVLQAFSVFRESVNVAAVSHVLGVQGDNSELKTILGRFARARIIRRELPRTDAAAPAGSPRRSSAPRFSLHPTDQDYAYRQLPEQGDWSRPALEQSAAAYYQSIRCPREQWRTREGIEPVMFEFDHLVKAGACAEAAALLDLIELDFLVLVGRAQKAREMHLLLEGKLTDPIGIARQLLGLGRAEIHLGSIETGRRRLQRALSLAEAHHQLALAAEISGWLGESARRLGLMADALACTTDAVRLSREAGDDTKLGRWLGELSLLCCYRGRIKEAVAHADEALEISTRQNQPEWIALAQDALALAWLVAGRPDEALRYAALALPAYEGSSWAPTSMYVRNVVGLAHAMSGRLPEAIAELERAQQLADTHHDVRVQGLVHFNLGRVRRRQNDRAAAAREIDLAVDIFERVKGGERVAAQELQRALEAEQRGDDRTRAAHLIASVQASLTCPDLLDPADLVDEIAAVAGRLADQEMEAQAAALASHLRAIRASTG